MKKLIIILTVLIVLLANTVAYGTIFYLDYENGDDANDGSDWANSWKTITLGATEALISPGDIIRIAKSPAPTQLTAGTKQATWTNLSKTVTLNAAETLTIDLCETAWTGTGDTIITRTAVATDGKEGSYCMKLAVDSSPQANILQAYYAIGTIDFSAYQKISFWIKNQAKIADATTWVVNLCSDTAGTIPVDTFVIPAITSTTRWIPLTLTKVGGGNLGNAIKSIAIYSGTTAPTASRYIYVDDFIACTTDGLNLQSLISKNTLEQGGTEGWYGIQSINGVTVLLDGNPNTKGNTGRGYSGATETVATYKRETIKTDLVSSNTVVVQDIQDSGTVGNNIEFQGGYNIVSNEQDGESFFDGLNGNGYGLQLSSKVYVTLNHLNFSRYYYGIYFDSSNNNTITTVLNACNNTYGLKFDSSNSNVITAITNANNNSYYGVFFTSSNNNTITTITNVNSNASGIRFTSSNNNIATAITNANNNSNSGIYFYAAKNNTITAITNANNNSYYGIYFDYSFNNTIVTITNANNNSYYGVFFGIGANNIILSINTSNNIIAGIYAESGYNYINNATIGEIIKVEGFSSYSNGKIFINNIGGFSNIWCDYGNIVSQDATAGGTRIEWKMSPTDVARDISYPLTLSIAKIAVVADKLVTIKTYFKKSHATDIGARLVCRGGQITGVASDEMDTCPEDTNRNELEITFTPTEAGVVEIEAWAYWLANAADENVIIDDMTITQAD